MNNTIATFAVDPKKRIIRDLKITQKQFKFKCTRKATLCCKLGGPVLTKKDINSIQSAGHSLEQFFNSENNKIQISSNTFGRLKTRPDGSCIFLDCDKQQNKHNCSIYESRPALCRLYPFHFEFLSAERIALKFIPCCMGLNDPDGKILDEQFINLVLLEPLLDAFELYKNGKT